jgi:predicted negative regulator of RcsB-dependent stress response
VSEEEKKDSATSDEADAASDAAEAKDADAKGADGKEAKAKGADADEAEAKAKGADDGDEAPSSEAKKPGNVADLAARVAALSADSPEELQAREEERKLAERRAKNRKAKRGKKGGGLETAASKRLSKIGERAVPKRAVAVAADADPLIERTAKLSEWAKKNQKLVTQLGVALVVVLLGSAGYMWWGQKREVEASVALAKAVADERGRIGEPAKGEDAPEETGPVFKTYEARREAALAKYRAVVAQHAGTGAAMLARLGEASILLDKREADAATAAYNEVKASPLAAADNEVRGRAIEGLGFAAELKAVAAGPSTEEAKKHFDAAIALYKELESSVDAKGFKELAMYHQARCHLAKGEKDRAKELLLSVKERTSKVDETPTTHGARTNAFPYLTEMTLDRLREIDPSLAPPKRFNEGPGGASMDLQLRQLIERMKKQQQQGGGQP